MKRNLQAAIVLMFTTTLHAQVLAPSHPSPQACPEWQASRNPLEVLSNTQGVDFGSYLTTVLAKVRRNWYSVIPKVALAPTMKKGCVALEFQILKDGSVAKESFVHSSLDDSLDRAAWTGIATSSPFPQLPPAFRGDYLCMRFTFYYNPDVSNARLAVGESKAVTVATASETGHTPQSIYQPFPTCSPASVHAHQGGTGVFSFMVTKKGDVKHVKVVDSLDKECDHESIKTMKRWKFEPTVRNGKAVEVPLVARVTLNW